MINSLLTGFNTAVRSMQTSQYALNLHSTNIAHANDPNYTKRGLVSPSETAVNGPGVLRLRDAFVDDQYRQASGVLGEAETREDVMGKVEEVFGDPVDGGLRQSIDQFFDAWQGLAENPGDGVARLQVLSAGRAFAQQIGSTYTRLSDIEGTINEQLTARVDDVNIALQKVFDLNKQISQMQRNNVDAAALEDDRDTALDDLAKLTGATATKLPDGTVRVFVGPTPVVDGPTVAKLTLVDGSNGPVPTWNVYNNPTYAGRGTINGLFGLRDGELARLKQEIDTLGKTVADQVNQVHQAGTGLDGSTGLAFFVVGPGPAQLSVNPDLDAKSIAAGNSGAPSDGNNARSLAALGETQMLSSVVLAGQMQSPRVYYRNLVGWIGSVTKDASQAKQIADTHVQANEQQRQSEFGVSMDEEVANLTVQQKAFAAAARVITVMDDMLDTLINRTGH